MGVADIFMVALESSSVLFLHGFLLTYLDTHNKKYNTNHYWKLVLITAKYISNNYLVYSKRKETLGYGIII